MMNLVPYEDEQAALRAFVDIAQSKRDRSRRQLLETLRPDIESIFRAYLERRGELAALDAPGPDVAAIRARLSGAREDLLHCYDGKTKARAALLAAIDKQQPRNAGRACQYCCGIGEARTWDHYLPKELFPEFAAFAPNLIRCCSTCNGYKGIAWIEGGRRLLINFYYDPIDRALRLVEGTIDVPAGHDPEPMFRRLEVDPNAPTFARLFARHWSLLHLEERLRHVAELKLDRVLATVRVLAPLGLEIQDLQDALAAEADRIAYSYGANHWEALLYRAAAASRAFVEYCRAGAQP